MDEGSQQPVGGYLALEFANTTAWDPDHPGASERIGSFQALLDWAVDRGLVSRKTHGLLTAEAQRIPDVATHVYQETLELRAAIHDVFSHYAKSSDSLPSGSLTVLNDALGKLPLKLRLSVGGGNWDWGATKADLRAVTWPVVWSAASLLTSPDLRMVKQCAGVGCGWLFVDESRRHNRKWCDMRDCGNRAKVRRHYYRHRGSG